ncbi:MAG: SHD1 domain-containing protein [Thermoguttaceae bacterium]|jgi:uncharacterized cupin superfamily protein
MTQYEVEASKNGKEAPFILVRIKATILRTRFMGDWDIMEVVDIQTCENGNWSPWHIEKILKKQAEEGAERERAEAEVKRIELEKVKAADKARAIARAREEEQRKAAIEAAKWRTWTDASGTEIGEAKFSGIIAGRVKLVKRDGSSVQVPLDKLSDEDREWIANRHK